MEKRGMTWSRVAAMVALVVVPGGSLVLVALALRRAYRAQSWPFGAGSLRGSWLAWLRPMRSEIAVQRA